MLAFVSALLYPVVCEYQPQPGVQFMPQQMPQPGFMPQMYAVDPQVAAAQNAFQQLLQGASQRAVQMAMETYIDSIGNQVVMPAGNAQGSSAYNGQDSTVTPNVPPSTDRTGGSSISSIGSTLAASGTVYMQKAAAGIRALNLTGPVAHILPIPEEGQQLSGAQMAVLTLFAILLIRLAGPLVRVVATLVFKADLSFNGTLHFLFSSDKRWNKKKVVDSAQLCTEEGNSLESVHVIFIRHGESAWNEVFNKGFGKTFPVRLISALLTELFMVPTRDSVFLDSPLSEEGVEQVQKLQQFLRKAANKDKDMNKGRPSTMKVGDGWDKVREKLDNTYGALGPSTVDPFVRRIQAKSVGGSTVEECCAILNGEKNAKPSVLVTSNLRRAISTCLVGLWCRLQKTRGSEKVLSMASLQEISTNVDCVCVARAGKLPPLTHTEEVLGMQIKELVDPSQNTGNKKVRSSGLSRLQEFAAYCFRNKDKVVIATGHSLWFREFFRTYLPKDSKHDAKTKKMVNAGVISFRLFRGDDDMGRLIYKIEPSTILSVYGGFARK